MTNKKENKKAFNINHVRGIVLHTIFKHYAGLAAVILLWLVSLIFLLKNQSVLNSNGWRLPVAIYIGLLGCFILYELRILAKNNALLVRLVDLTEMLNIYDNFFNGELTPDQMEVVDEEDNVIKLDDEAKKDIAKIIKNAKKESSNHK